MHKIKNSKAYQTRRLQDLVSVGPAALQDFALLGIKTIDELADKKAHLLYQRLCWITEKQHDPCVEDVFSAAIAQAQNPDLPAEECQWWYWSRKRKQPNETNK